MSGAGQLLGKVVDVVAVDVDVGEDVVGPVAAEKSISSSSANSSTKSWKGSVIEKCLINNHRWIDTRVNSCLDIYSAFVTLFSGIFQFSVQFGRLPKLASLIKKDFCCEKFTNTWHKSQSTKIVCLMQIESLTKR